MKTNSILLIVFMAVFCSIVGIEGDQSHPCIEVSRDAFRLILYCCDALYCKTEPRLPNQEGYYPRFLRDKHIKDTFNLRDVESDFQKLGGGFTFEGCDSAKDVVKYIRDTVIYPAIEQGIIFLKPYPCTLEGEPLMHVAREHVTYLPMSWSLVTYNTQPSSPLAKASPRLEHKSQEDLSIALIYSPFFKASCVATAVGAITYCTLNFYNKDKTKEQQYSKFKWSLGAAAVVGASTYWYLR